MCDRCILFMCVVCKVEYGGNARICPYCGQPTALNQATTKQNKRKEVALDIAVKQSS